MSSIGLPPPDDTAMDEQVVHHARHLPREVEHDVESLAQLLAAGKRLAIAPAVLAPIMMLPSGLRRSWATTARICSRSLTAARNCSCTRYSGVMSSATATAPETRPRSLRSGAAQLMIVR